MALKDSETRFTFFFPDARLLNEVEIAAIPTEKKKAARMEMIFRKLPGYYLL